MSQRFEELLPGYLLGELSPEELAWVEDAVSSSKDKARVLREFVEAYHAVAATAPALQPSPGGRQRLLDDLRPGARFDPYIDRLVQMLDLSREKVQELLASLDEPGTEWEPGPVGGTKLIHLPGGPRLAGAIVGFVWVDAGLEFPHHKHLGEESVLVLQGALRDEDGAVLEPGGVRVMAADTAHTFVALDGPPLIYVVTVFDGVEF